nr:diguanylate cyclase [Acholeplasmatales bacterium]
YLTDCFRFLDIHNEIIWRRIKVLSATVTDEDRFLILGRTFTDYENNYFNSIKKIIDLNETEKISDATNMDLDDIFRAVVQSSDRYFFWKDKERRFLGASQAFLDVYDIKNVAEIVGKTDEDIGWNVTELEYMNDEFDVINKGKIIRNVVGRCIIRGVPHNIACSKWPVYNKGKIVGLFGYFIDLDQEEDLLRNELGLVDTETGILNNRGFIESLMSYIAEAKSLNSSFTLIRINLNRIDEIGKLLGKEMAFAVEKEVAKTLKNFFGLSDSISHIGYGRFVILKAYMEKEEADLYCKKIEDKLLEIKEAAGVPITIYSTVTALSSAEAENSPEKLINLANLKD